MTDLELDDELQRQLRRWGDDLARLVPPYRHPPTSARLAPATQRRPLWLVAAVVATVVVGAGALWRAQTDSTSRVATQGGAIMVRHERIEVRISANLLCAPIDASATFDHATVDTWADTERRRYRTRVTYPDGSNYDVIALGSPYYPTELYERGQRDSRNVAPEPATDDLYDHDGYAKQPVRSPPTDSGPAPTTPRRNPSTSTI